MSDLQISKAVKAMQETRAFRAGMAFGVPEDARDHFATALATAALESLTQTVSTPAEFDALPDGSVITWGGIVCQKNPPGFAGGWYQMGYDDPIRPESFLLDSENQPWTVIGGGK